ncbi:DUF1799 domain-containing protein [Halomonas elongata]|uniref:DUF1799 domain-containing protein n=1 Tax=Halomonas elongata TaxID=2746 RepID=UPI00186B776D|nr:DUF1799 domain-containing protein [Halomonas elongata]MBW5802049.1 DUF1799 domain-containing protein [Halomonas elongata]
MKRAQHCEVWPEHLTALEVFISCAEQWRVIAGFGVIRYQGIDAAALQATMTMLGVEDTRETLLQVREIQAGALECMQS